jgi:transposase InsO family protein
LKSEATTFKEMQPEIPRSIIHPQSTNSIPLTFHSSLGYALSSANPVSMDWYSRCITGLRVTGSTKSIDVSSTLFHTYRPRPAPQEWPEHAVWPEHGIPRGVLIDRGAMDGPVVAAAGPALVPETIVVDHGEVYISEHITSVCRRLGMSIQPARLRTGRDKGPIERFFRTLRQGLLEALPGYKGPDVYSRGLDPEGEAFLFIDELDAIIREWIAVVFTDRR